MSVSTAKASINGSSVVPGLPNMTLTPSCLSRSRKARFPDITGKIDSYGKYSRADKHKAAIHSRNTAQWLCGNCLRIGEQEGCGAEGSPWAMKPKYLFAHRKTISRYSMSCV